MPQLSQKTRDQLPDRDFAYIDSRGRRRLPINDEAHVRNALSRFNQTAFEDEAARDLARTRLLKAAKKFGIVPVGFMTGQLTNARMRGEVDARAVEVFAVFAQAPSALDAALAVQRKVLARTWPDGIQVRIRIGLHTGEPT